MCGDKLGVNDRRLNSIDLTDKLEDEGRRLKYAP